MVSETFACQLHKLREATGSTTFVLTKRAGGQSKRSIVSNKAAMSRYGRRCSGSLAHLAWISQDLSIQHLNGRKRHWRGQE